MVRGIGKSTEGEEAFRWTDDTGMVGLGDLPGGDVYSNAYGISADGSTVVGYSFSSNGSEAFRWTEESGMLGLGFPEGAHESTALCASADGSVVGGVCKIGSPQYAFIWDAERGMRNLMDVMECEYHLDLTGWRLQGAKSMTITTDGLTVVGSGVNPSGSLEAWIARLPGWPLPDPPQLMESYSVARHSASGAYPGGYVELSIDLEHGLVEPREQDATEMSLRMVFDGRVAVDDFTVTVTPDPGISPTISAGATHTELVLTFDGTFPTGKYEYSLDSESGPSQVFAVCYSQGDVNCSGDTTGLDLAVIQGPANWNLDLSAAADPRADVNRDGEVTGTDLAKVQSPAFWNRPVPPLDCACP